MVILTRSRSTKMVQWWFGAPNVLQKRCGDLERHGESQRMRGKVPLFFLIVASHNARLMATGGIVTKVHRHRSLCILGALVYVRNFVVAM